MCVVALLTKLIHIDTHSWSCGSYNDNRIMISKTNVKAIIIIKYRMTIKSVIRFFSGVAINCN